jgi:hypothetical protein
MLEAVTVLRPLSVAARDVAWARRGALAVLVEPDGRHWDGIIAGALAPASGCAMVVAVGRRVRPALAEEEVIDSSFLFASVRWAAHDTRFARH